MRGNIYGEIKDKLLEIRTKEFDKIIKCYVITKNMNVYPITRISKRNIYSLNNVGEEVLIKDSILEFYEDVMSVHLALNDLKATYEKKLQNLYEALYKINEANKYFEGLKKN